MKGDKLQKNEMGKSHKKERFEKVQFQKFNQRRNKSQLVR